MNVIELQWLVKHENFNISLDYLSKEDWFRISKFLKLNEEFMSEYSQLLNWEEIWFGQEYSLKFVEMHVTRLTRSGWLNVFNKTIPTLNFLRNFWNILISSDNYFTVKLHEWCRSAQLDDCKFVGIAENKKHRIEWLVDNDHEPYMKWHFLNQVTGLNIFADHNSENTISGIGNRCYTGNNSKVVDQGHGSIIHVGSNSVIITDQTYDDQSRFWMWLNGSSANSGYGYDNADLHHTRPEWSKHHSLRVKLGKNSSIVMNITLGPRFKIVEKENIKPDDYQMYRTYKAGIDLEIDEEYEFDVNNLEWKRV